MQIHGSPGSFLRTEALADQRANNPAQHISHTGSRHAGIAGGIDPYLILMGGNNSSNSLEDDGALPSGLVEKLTAKHLAVVGTFAKTLGVRLIMPRALIPQPTANE